MAETVTIEMGKPINQSYKEIDQCIELLDYYCDSEHLINDEKFKISTGNDCSIVHQPLGPVLAIMPYSFPVWLPFREVIPPMVLGNSIMLKHSETTPKCGIILEEIFREAGFGKGEYSNMHIDYAQCEQILADRRVRALKFSGSTPVGKKIASLCGKYMKKSSFNLGGNDPFVVLKEADVEKAIETGFKSRMDNNGQSCINAKRFIINEQVYDQFKEGLIEKIKSEVKIGDPLDSEVTLGPLASAKVKNTLKKQVQRAIKKDGGTIAYGNPEVDYLGFADNKELRNGNWVEPLVIENIDIDSQTHKEEILGPVFQLHKVISQKHALDLANKTDFGLSASIFTENEQKLNHASMRLRAGTVFLNGSSFTAPDFPNGGIKGSGYGRECYSDGLVEISNRKSIIR